jgi:hypothetical protein
MARSFRKTAALGAGALLAVAGAGAAIAATQTGPLAESEALVDDAAKRLGVSSGELSAALQAALAARIDEAVSAGRLTEEQGAELKERIRAGEVPLLGLGGPHGGRHGGPGGPGGGLDAAAGYLGVTEAELHERLHDGETLAEVAGTEGRSVDGLVDALVADEAERLAQAVEDGRLTDAQRDELVAGLEERVTARVNGEGGVGRGHGFGPPGAPPADDEGTDDSASSPSVQSTAVF